MKITLLTAAFNPGPGLRDCLESVAEQELPAGVELEHLVLDGGSTDGTVGLLQTWAAGAPGRRYRSGPDGGFYDALNSGIRSASGDIVGTLNADDFYFDARVLARVAEAFAGPGVDGVYGDLVYIGGGGGPAGFRVKRYWKSGEFRRRAFLQGWMPPHPTVFVRREVYERSGGFRTDFDSAADYEWLVRVMVRDRASFRYIPRVLVAMRVGGMSNRSLAARLAANKNDRRAWAINGLRPLPWTFLLKPLRKLSQWVTWRPGSEMPRVRSGRCEANKGGPD